MTVPLFEVQFKPKLVQEDLGREEYHPTFPFPALIAASVTAGAISFWHSRTLLPDMAPSAPWMSSSERYRFAPGTCTNEALGNQNVRGSCVPLSARELRTPQLSAAQLPGCLGAWPFLGALDAMDEL